MSTLLVSRYPMQGRVTRLAATRGRTDGGKFRPALNAFFPLSTATGQKNPLVAGTASGPNIVTRVGPGTNAAVKSG